MSVRRRGRPPKKDMNGDVARDRLLKAGAALFTERPYDSVTVDEIAAAAGVAHGLLFHHFGSKHGLYVAMTRRAVERLERIHLEEPPPEVPPEEKLAAFLRRHMDFIRQWPTAYVLHARGALSAEVRGIWEESRQRTLRIVLRYFGTEEPSPRRLALVRSWLALFDELVLAWIQDPSIEKESVVRISVDAFRDLMGRAHQLDPAPEQAGTAPG